MHNNLFIPDANFWDECWRTGLTGWDLGAPSPPLVDFFDTINNKELHILIPGCGNAYEAEYLLRHGFKNISVLDISFEAVKILKNKFNDSAIKVIHEDFFQHRGNYDLIIEQTFFCAIHPSMRKDYVRHAFDLLKENGRLCGLLFNCTFDNNFPPYGGSKEEYITLFSPYFIIKKMDITPLSVKPRLGKELFIELEKRSWYEDKQDL
ncbi:MAG: methyltransferase domain-containing protein [Chitinophagales bacterium]|nr:TPMT family class I SAM-dependent methyltransferase [Chitinophagales bacterium]MDW8273069.1 methyltransferase domain-containing protein [Chitinophagales bacterium]